SPAEEVYGLASETPASTLEFNGMPVIRLERWDDVDLDHVVAILEPVAQSRPEVAHCIRCASGAR
ncbi:MAG: hypothetical protein ACXW3Y_14245, partial [Rhodoplanes sp.]